ncbi:hypothetical protein [Stygiolobus caldivivus]|uniref:Thermopsin n=1 Tax=Stygiolobus caldivivus TaxID=2824673 RepID=A0A8D5ZJC5_9CREN|nr:hypothetical protein [Stygiolobus caldivivus]BCU70230.1 hypothetical protein KN1_15270 [Stygiolobus caldivivus]
MDVKFILYAFLIQGMVFSYTWSGYYIGGGQILSYHYNMTYTWLDTGINVNIVGNVSTQYQGAPIKPQVQPYSASSLMPTYYSLFYPDKYGPEEFILYFTNFTTTTADVKGEEIPAIKFYRGNSYLIVSAQYGFPIQGYAQNYLPYSSATSFDNISINLTDVKPLPNLTSSETLYQVLLHLRVNQTSTLTKAVYVVSSKSTITASSVTHEINNKSFSYTSININANGYATIILPLSGFPITEPLGQITVDGKNYYFYMNQTINPFGVYYTAIYENTSNPYMAVTIGKYFVIFVPNGGNISLTLDDQQNPLVSYQVINMDSPLQQLESNHLIYYIIPAVVAIIAVLVIAVLRHRRAS